MQGFLMKAKGIHDQLLAIGAYRFRIHTLHNHMGIACMHVPNMYSMCVCARAMHVWYVCVCVPCLVYALKGCIVLGMHLGFA